MMKITSISSINLYNNNKIVSLKQNKQINNKTNNSDNCNFAYYPLLDFNMPKTMSFMGHNVHIVDAGTHAQNMQHFLSAVNPRVDIQMHEVEESKLYRFTKQLASVEKTLKNLNKRDDLYGDYVAVIALADVPILNLQDQFNEVMGENRKFTPENIKANKKDILLFLEELYMEPRSYYKYIKYMDSAKQGIEYTYGIIKEINKLIQKGAKVYVPSGHPQDKTLKWAVEEAGLKPELYNFISTGVDKNNVIEKIHYYIKHRNWYDFNLLSLSNANIVAMSDAQGAQEYMFSANDSCVNDKQPGIYNFYPIRKDGEVIGYSYTDRENNQYPYSEFPANNELANILKFVGRDLSDVLASKNEIIQLQRCNKNKRALAKCPDKLYPVEEVFTSDEIVKNKYYLMGDYVNRNLNLFFRKNIISEVIYPKANCEGSQRPSVIPMWGSCFSVMNAISRDIYIEDRNKTNKHQNEHEAQIYELMNSINSDIGYSACSEALLVQAKMLDKAFKLKHPNHYLMYEPYYYLGTIYYNEGKMDKAEEAFNTAINILSKKIVEGENTDLLEIEKNINNIWILRKLQKRMI